MFPKILLIEIIGHATQRMPIGLGVASHSVIVALTPLIAVVTGDRVKWLVYNVA